MRATTPSIKRTTWALWALVVGGPLLTGLVGRRIYVATEGEARRAFEQVADARTRAVQQTVEVDVGLLRATEAFEAGREEVEGREIESFFRRLRGPRGSPDSLLWVPRVPEADRAAFEARLRGGVPAFRLEERCSEGRRVPSGPRAEYHPVAVATGPADESALLGLDLGPEPAVASAIAAATDSGSPAATGALRLDGGGPVVLVLQPIYRGRRAPVTEEERRSFLLGHAAALWRVPALLDRARPTGATEDVDAALYEEDGGARRTLGVLVAASRGRDDAKAVREAFEAGTPPPAKSDLVVAAPVAVPGRHWVVEMRAAPAYDAGPGQRFVWGVVGAGLLGTALLVGLVASLLRRERAGEHVVAERTAALSLANRDLRTEIEERSSAEEALQRSQRELRTILDSVPALVWAKDSKDVVVRANRGAAALAGLSVEDAAGKPVSALFPNDAARFHESDLDVLRSGAAKRTALEAVTLRDGAKRWLEVDRLPFRDETGRVAGVIAFAQDVTERVEAETKARESEDVFRAISVDLPDGLLLIDPAQGGQVVHANEAACRLHGLAAEEILGTRIHDLLDAESARRLPERVQRLLAGETLHYDEAHRARDGRTFPVEVTARRIRRQGRDLVLVIDRDVTERRRAEDERRRLEARMQHAQRLESLGVLAGGIAHDFNNLLMGILGNADLALKDLTDATPARERVEDVRLAGVRARELTQQMLAYSGRGTFVVGPLDLGALVRDMANLLRVSIGRAVRLEMALAPSLPPVMADAAQIRQIVMNLLTNASEAIGDRPGVVTVSTGVAAVDRAYLAAGAPDADLPEGEYVWLEVADTGSGMDEATRARIFDPFFTTKFTGRGLGLAAVMGIVRGHRGAIRVESAIGKGSTFRVLLPAARDAAVPPATEASPASHRAWFGHGTVLVIDDDDTVRTVVRRMLVRHGLRVREATDGPAGVAILRDDPTGVSAVLLDLTMPQMSGEDAFREIVGVRADLPVILMSGFTEQDAAARFHGLGLAGFVQKPFESDALVTALRVALERPPPRGPHRKPAPRRVKRAP